MIPAVGGCTIFSAPGPMVTVKHLRHSKNTGDYKISTQNPSHGTFFLTIELSEKLAGNLPFLQRSWEVSNEISLRTWNVYFS